MSNTTTNGTFIIEELANRLAIDDLRRREQVAGRRIRGKKGISILDDAAFVESNASKFPGGER